MFESIRNLFSRKQQSMDTTTIEKNRAITLDDFKSHFQKNNLNEFVENAELVAAIKSKINPVTKRNIIRLDFTWMFLGL